MGQEEVRHDHERLYARQTPESILQSSEQLRSTPEQQLIRSTPEQQLMRRTPEQFTKNPQEAYQKNPQEQFLRRPPSNPPTFLSQASFQPGARMEEGRDFSSRPGRDAIYSPSFVNYESQVEFFKITCYFKIVFYLLILYSSNVISFSGFKSSL